MIRIKKLRIGTRVKFTSVPLESIYKITGHTECSMRNCTLYSDCGIKHLLLRDDPHIDISTHQIALCLVDLGTEDPNKLIVDIIDSPKVLLNKLVDTN